MITLTNGVQIPENAVQLQTTAAIDGYYVTQPLRLVQYDETLPVAAVQLTYQNQPYTPPTGAELNVRMGKPDGKGVYNPCLGVDSNGVVYFAFTLQMTIVAGYGTLTVEVTDSGVKNSAPIIAEIRSNPVPEGSIESADEFLTLQEILTEAKKWGQIVQANASNIQQVVDNLEDIQNAAENAQAAAESAAAAQQAAQEALGFRTFFSTVRPDTNGNLDPSRPMAVGPAASLTIESEGDRIQSVTALGFTQQAGTGDPSPSNVRQLTNGGLKLVAKTFNGSETWYYSGEGDKALFICKSAIPGNSKIPTGIFSGRYKYANINFSNNLQGISGWDDELYIRDSRFSNLESFKADLQANPLPVWYPTADATGLYAPIIIEGGEYHATCLPLTAPLCEGDSVVSWVKSGCDKVATFDGSEDEGWAWLKSPSGVYRAYVSGFSDYLAGETKLTNAYVSGDVASQVGVFSISGGNFLVTPKDFQTDDGLSQFTAALAAHPLTVWYRSTKYTPAADIPVSLETHQQSVLVLDGTENMRSTPGTVQGTVQMTTDVNLKPNGNYGGCSHYKFIAGTEPVQNRVLNTLVMSNTSSTANFFVSEESSPEDFKANLAAQYAAGTPVTIVYQLATPITYAHPAVVLEAATGDQLTYTVTGQSGGTVSVALKPFQDGGHAKTADNATNAQNADNATQFDGHAWSEVPGQAPVQSVNSKTGAVTLTAADVGAATAAQGQKADSALIFMGFLPNGTAVNSIQNGIWDGDASHRPNPAPDGLNEDLTIVKAGRYLQATDVFGNAKRWNFYSSVWSDPV